MKKRRNLLFIVTLLLSITLITGCNSSSNNEKQIYGVDETFEYDGLEITIGSNYTISTINNEYYTDDNGKEEIKLPITIKNISDDTNSLNSFSYKIYGSAGTIVESYYTMSDDDLLGAGDLRSGASYTKYLYFIYDGDGEYVMEFDNWPNASTEVKFNISK